LGHPQWDIIVHDAIQDKEPPADIAVALAGPKYACPCYFTNIYVIYIRCRSEPQVLSLYPTPTALLTYIGSRFNSSGKGDFQ